MQNELLKLLIWTQKQEEDYQRARLEERMDGQDGWEAWGPGRDWDLAEPWRMALDSTRPCHEAHGGPQPTAGGRGRDRGPSPWCRHVHRAVGTALTWKPVSSPSPAPRHGVQSLLTSSALPPSSGKQGPDHHPEPLPRAGLPAVQGVRQPSA